MDGFKWLGKKASWKASSLCYYEFLLTSYGSHIGTLAYLTLFNQNNTHIEMNAYEYKYNVKDKKIWPVQLAS